MSAAAKRTGVVSQNIGAAVSFLQTQDSGLKTIAKMLDRMSELKALHTNETATAQQGNYATEFNALNTEITNLSNYTANGVALFGATAVKVFTSAELSTSDQVSFGVAYVSTNSTGAMASLGNMASTNSTAANIATAIDTVANMRAENGAKQNVLGFYDELATATKTNYESAVSRIVDVDVAAESTQLARWSTLVQAGTAMIAQANGSTQAALSLLR